MIPMRLPVLLLLLVVAAAPLADGNREAVQACREQAEKAKKPVRCTIEVRPATAQ